MKTTSVMMAALALGLFALLAQTGCTDPPAAESPPPIPNYQLPPPSAIWHQTAMSDLVADKFARAAVVEFRIDLITKIDEPRLNAGTGITKRSKRKTVYDPAFRQRLVNELHGLFCTQLESYGVSLVPVSEVQASTVYQQLPSLGSFMPVLIDPTPNASDGVIALSILRCSSQGLKLLRVGDDLEWARQGNALMAQLDADVIVRAHFQIGVGRGQVSFEPGSRVSLLRPSGRGWSESRRSYRAGPQVLEQPPSMAGELVTDHVDSGKFLQAVREIFPLYVRGALD